MSLLLPYHYYYHQRGQSDIWTPSLIQIKHGVRIVGRVPESGTSSGSLLRTPYLFTDVLNYYTFIIP